MYSWQRKGPGLFNDIIEQAKNMSVDERVDLLENSKELAQLHASAATEGQTAVQLQSCGCRHEYLPCSA